LTDATVVSSASATFPAENPSTSQMAAIPPTPVVHLELHTPDLHGARDFYAGRPAGWRSVVTTTAGAEIALWQQKR
jgi:predicted enzyme related to lactoylglutathione lyase